jgi:Amt family ammonium transporter
MHINSGDTAWLLISAALVLFMTPGLAAFYGGLVSSKNVLSIMMQTFAAIAIITVTWVIMGYSIAFARSGAGNLFGTFSYLGLSNMKTVAGFKNLTVDPMAYSSFQLMFAIITGALIAGGVTGRMKFSSYCIFIAIWSIFIYAPIAHWAFSPVGFLAKAHILDFAGGTVVEINSGFSTLGLVLALGPRLKFLSEHHRPHSVPIALIGVGILWFGWFGFNAGSALAANAIASIAFINTQIAASCGLIGWEIIEWWKGRKPTTLGAGSGAIAGMVAITPCAGYVSSFPAILIGLAAGLICAAAVRMKFKFKLDDSLDVLGVHGIGGVVGMFLLGLFASKVVNSGGQNGLFYGGGSHQLAIQCLGILLSAAYATGGSFVIAWLLKKTIGLRVDPEIEYSGLDLSEHAEVAYNLGD